MTGDPNDDIPFPADESSEVEGREPGSDDDTPIAEGGAPPHVSFYQMPFPDDDAPLPEERNEDPADSHRGEPELEIDTRPISQRASARQELPADPNADYLKGLNPEQREAVINTEGPLLVLAGAGTGKTRVLTTRVAHILAQRKAWPSQMLVVTFTNKAAREMRERTLALIGPEGEGLRWFGTFHSVSAQILRRHAELVKLKSGFTVLDTDDQLRLIRQILEAENIDQKRWTPRYLASLIDGWKNRAIWPEKLPQDESRQFAEGKGKKLYEIYQARLATLNAVDFGDLLLHTIRIFTEHRQVLADYHAKFKYLLVDEYQDTNVAQYLWLRLLAQGNGNICCVGDDDQCLVAGTLVTMADGTHRRIEQVRAGEHVLSSFGSGDFRPARVTEVFERNRSGPAIRLTTAAGRVLTSTPEHIHFAGYRLGIVPQTYFVYLMRKDGVGFRLGTSQVYTKGQQKPTVGFEQRLRQEHGDALWILATHDSENEARAQEYELSLRYAIPTLPFTPRKGGSRNGLVHDERYIKRVFETFDTASSAERLLRDLGLSLNAPHHRPRSRNSSRRNVVVTLCGDSRGRTPMHRISIVGNDEAGRTELSALGLSVRSAKAGSASWRFETASADFGAIAATVETIGSTMPINIFRVARLGAQAGEAAETNSLPFTPAAFLRPGMALFDEHGGYDIVAKVERTEVNGPVYDLNVERTHNFIANGIVTHNSIYGWRGAEVDNILRFDKDFPGAKVIRLEQNYRSTAHILAAASGVIAQNASRLGKTLRTDAGEGDLVKVRGVWDGEQEARLISDDITSWRQSGRRYDNCAVLVRASWQMRAFEERFIVTGTPYRVIGGPRFFERAEIRDAMAYLRLIRSEADDLAFERVVNQPKRGVGDTTIQKMHVAARGLNTYLTRAADMMIRGEEIRGPAKTGVRRFILDMERWRAMYAMKDGEHVTEHPRLLEIILEESGYTDMLQADKSPQSQTRLDNLKELVRAMGAFDTLNAFLEHVELVMDNAEGSGAEDQVQILTLHSAKGLEWPMVFLPGWEEEVFPSRRSLDESGAKGLEEERRLAYVGITRARERAYISFAANRQIYGRWTSVLPSRFIDELPPKHVDAVSETGYVAPSGGFYGSETNTFTSRWDAPGASPSSTAGGGGGGSRSEGLRDGGGRPQGGSFSEGNIRGGYDTPGWKRAQAATASRAATRPPDIDGRAFRTDDSDGRPLARGRTPGDMLASSDPAAAGGLSLNDRIFHEKFGYGRVREIDGAKLTVEFDKAGVKKVVESFVKRV